MRKAGFILLVIFLFSFSVLAEEGMWLLTQLNLLELEKKGLKLTVEDIYHPDKPSLTDAIVWLGGCTASFVSPNGLILTNQKRIFGYIHLHTVLVFLKLFNWHKIFPVLIVLRILPFLVSKLKQSRDLVKNFPHLLKKEHQKPSK